MAVLLLQVQAGAAWAETVTLTPPYAESSTSRSCLGGTECVAEATADHTTGELSFNVAVAAAGSGSANARGTIVGTHTLEAEANAIDYSVNVHITELLTEASTFASLSAEASHTACSQCSSGATISWSPPSAVAGEDVSIAFTLTNQGGGPIPQGTIRIVVSFGGGANAGCNIFPPSCGPQSSGSGRATVTSMEGAWNNNPAAAHPGPLDATFDTDGKVTTDFAGGSDRANAVAIQGDGKIVAAGGGGPGFALARYNSDGSLDTTFGGDGRVTTDFPGFTEANAVAIQGWDGKIVAAGGAGDFCTSCDFALARYNTDGSLDPTFGGDGTVTTDFDFESPGGGDEARAVAIQGDGKIVAAGVVGSTSVRFVGPVRRRDFALARYNTDGSLDPNFDIDGKVTTDFAGQNDEANAVAIQGGDGKIVAAGFANPRTFSNTSSLDDFALARYNTNGTLDPTFGVVGKVTTDFVGWDDEAKAVAIQGKDGKIVVAGGACDFCSSSDFTLARYNTDGSLDPTFDTDGKVTTDFAGPDLANAVAIQEDGKIVAAGSGPFALARYNTDGSLDPTFGGAGMVTTGFPGGLASAVAIQGDGKIVAAGVALGDFALARYRIHDEADLSITKTGPSGRVPTGRNMTYALTVTNNGPDSAFGVTITDQLPPTVTFVSVTATQGSCGESTGTVSCTLGEMSSGAIVTIEIVVRPTTAGRITNSALVASPTPDSNQGNNADSEDTSICRITSRRSSIPCG